MAWHRSAYMFGTITPLDGEAGKVEALAEIFSVYWLNLYAKAPGFDLPA